MVLNLAPQPGETERLRARDHLEVLAEHAPDLQLDVVLADPTTVPDHVALERSAAARSVRELVLCADFGSSPMERRGTIPSHARRGCTELVSRASGRIGRMAMTAQVKDELAST